MEEPEYDGYFDVGDDLEEEMQRDYLQHLLEEEGGPEEQEEEEAVAAAAAAPVGAVMDALNKAPTSSSTTTTTTAYSSSSSSSYRFASYEKPARNPTIAEFAQELQKARASALNRGGGASASAAHAMLNITDMVTEREQNLPTCADGGKFLHKFCEETSAAHVPCILSNGSRFYLRKRQTAGGAASPSGSRVSTATASGGGAKEAAWGQGLGNMLSKPLSELQKEADRIQTEVLADRKLREDAKREAELYGTNMPSEDVGIESALRNAAAAGEKSLWVEKYAPKLFSQLLSEEKLNREVLGALKAWSPYVFRGPTTAAANQQQQLGGTSNFSTIGTLGGAGMRSSATKEPSSASKNSKASQHEENDSGVDDDDGNDNDGADGGFGDRAAARNDVRPFFKALLICGPPGTGKTTLAHVLAKHCGYRPFEVNASDDRSHDVLKDNLTRAMHGNTVTGERLPNCIILDEIDGIDGKNSIDMLVKMIRAPLRVKGQRGKAGGGKNAPSSVTPLTRPLICICNDQYAPSLRELRKFAKVFVFHPPTELRLVARLKAICESEKISNVSPQSLAALSSATGNDIRSAINTLQFAALRTSALKQSAVQQPGGPKGGASTSSSGFGSMLSSMISSGLKDVNRDAFQVWREIFSVREMSLAAAKKKSIINNNKQAGVGAGAQAQSGLLAAASKSNAKGGTQSSVVAGPEAAVLAMADFGDSNLILGGIFHNLLTIRYNDPSMTRSHLASDWISSVDQFDCFASGSGGNVGSGGGNSDSVGYQLMPYISSVAGAVHLYCSADEKVKISWPSGEKDAYYKRKSKGNILETLLNSAKLGTFCMRSKVPVVLDVLSFLVDITTPKIRQVSFLTLTQPEQEALADCVQVMASVGLSYSSSNPSAEGSSFYASNNSTLSLDPAIMELLSFCKCDDLKGR